MMNKEQYEEARKVLAADCATCGNYCDDLGTCAIGALALAAGVDKEVLIIAESLGIGAVMPSIIWSQETVDAVTQMRQAIYAKFGLTGENQSTIQRWNDSVRDNKEGSIFKREERRRVVLHALDRIYWFVSHNPEVNPEVVI